MYSVHCWARVVLVEAQTTYVLVAVGLGWSRIPTESIIFPDPEQASLDDRPSNLRGHVTGVLSKSQRTLLMDHR